MRALSKLAVAAVLLAAPAYADQTNSNSGSQAAPWLGLSNNARNAAMGGAGVAVADDVNAASLNPAGLAQLKGQEVSLMHKAYVLDSSIEHLGYGLGLNDHLGVALSLDYMNYGSVDKFSLDATNKLVASGSFNPSSYHVDLGSGYAIGALSAGLNLKVVGQSLDGGSSTSAFAVDLGTMWKTEGGFSLGLALQDLGSQLDGANLPTAVRLGGAYRLGLGDNGLTLAADLAAPEADSSASTLGLGLEFNGHDAYALRAGYLAAGNGGASGLTLGAGLGYKILHLDYAFSAVGVLGNSNQISALLQF